MKQKVRVAAVLIENDKILLVQQKVSSSRNWSLPGGTLEAGESIEQCIIREMKEETGLDVTIDKLLYIGDRIEGEMHTVHITILVKRWSGQIQVGYEPEVEANPITGIEMIPICSLREYGFSQCFYELALQNFPSSGNYVGSVKNIGL